MAAKIKPQNDIAAGNPTYPAGSEADSLEINRKRQETYGSSRPKPPPTLLASDLKVKGNVKTTGNVRIEGNIEGNVHAHLLIVSEHATIFGDIVADDVEIEGTVFGRIFSLKVRLAPSAIVNGDIIYTTIAIQSGAHFEGSIKREDDPLASANYPPTSRKRVDETDGSIPDDINGAVFLNMNSAAEVDKLTRAAEDFVRYLGYEIELEQSDAG